MNQINGAVFDAKMGKWIGVMLTILVMAACERKPHEAAGGLQLPAGPALPVRVMRVTSMDHTSVEEVVGTVRSKQQALVEAKVLGRVEQYLVVPGQVVKAGELLAQLDVREALARLESARAMLEQADRELARYQKLESQNAATRQDLDSREAQQKVTSATVREMETMVGHARVTAPFDGVVTRKLAEVGDLAMPGKPLLEMESLKGLRLEADLPEALFDKVRMDQQMTAKISGESMEVRVSEIAPIADPVSRTFRVKMDLPESQTVRTGQFGRVGVPVAEGKILAVPATAVIKRGQIEGVFVVSEGRAWLRLVRTGRRVDAAVELLSGVDEGEEVIRAVPPRFVDGQPVEVKL